MSGAPSPLDNFSGRARLFPLPNLVLFPYVIQPLHIFEPRYRDLMADCLQDDRLITMALLRPGWEEEYHGRPAIHPVVCVGGVVKEELLPDGRYNLLLHGLSRARVVEELPSEKLYRLARVELLEDVPVASPLAEQRLRRRLGEHVRAWIAPQAAALAQLQKLLGGGLPLGTLCDIFSFMLTIDVEVKQELLGQLDVEARARRLLAHLETCPPGQAPQPARHKFPPDFSAN
jgi:Lon protease-like protein